MSTQIETIPESVEEVSRVPKQRRLATQKLGGVGWTCVGVLTFWGLIALFAPILAPHPESALIAKKVFGHVGAEGLALGSDYMGRDVLSRMIYGARMTIGLALSACLLAFAVGTVGGFTAGLLGGRTDDVLSRINDAFLAFPSIMLALIVISALGTSLTILVLAVGFIEATRNFRVARALGMDISVMDFVEVSRARGESTLWILRHEVLPNSFIPLSTDFGLRFTYSILLISAISFLGLGVQPPYADWGGMIRENMAGIHFYANATLLPAFAIFSMTLAINFLVDWNLSRSNKDISDEMIKH